MKPLAKKTFLPLKQLLQMGLCQSLAVPQLRRWSGDFVQHQVMGMSPKLLRGVQAWLLRSHLNQFFSLHQCLLVAVILSKLTAMHSNGHVF